MYTKNIFGQYSERCTLAEAQIVFNDEIYQNNDNGSTFLYQLGWFFFLSKNKCFFLILIFNTFTHTFLIGWFVDPWGWAADSHSSLSQAIHPHLCSSQHHSWWWWWWIVIVGDVDGDDDKLSLTILLAMILTGMSLSFHICAHHKATPYDDGGWLVVMLITMMTILLVIRW